jgi:CTP:phosphocholine cytidylyltransferase-like protein
MKKTPLVVRKAVLPVAGLGTRMLPATKAIPKEMLPVVDKPLIQYVVREAIAAGIKEIILVTHSSKNSIENHFDKSFELEATLEKVTDVSEIMNYGIMSTPAIVADGKVLSYGRVLETEEIKKLMIADLWYIDTELNKFNNIDLKETFDKYAIKVNEDTWALSEVVQFLYRSSIRNGHSIHLYIPSRRMRNLVKTWLAP